MDVVHTVSVEAGIGDVGIEQAWGNADGLEHVRQSGGFGHPVRDVDAETVDPPAQPEPQGSLEIDGDLRVLPVQVGLLGRE